MFHRRFPVVDQEGVPLLLALIAVAVILARFVGGWYAVPPLAAFVVLVLLFRDPHREIPPVALGVVSPVDGVVESIGEVRRCVIQGEARCIRIRADWTGAYTVRSPVEGLVMDLNARPEGIGPECPANALWVRTDEGGNVVLQFHEHRLGIAPRAFVRYGERIGQGKRCANLRLARIAEVYVPVNAKIDVEVGQRVQAGVDLIGYLPTK